VHAVNFAILIVALFAFDFSWGAAAASRESARELRLASGRDTAAILLAYAIFLYCTLELNGLGLVTPDLCLAATVFTGRSPAAARPGGPSWKDSLSASGSLDSDTSPRA